MNVLFNYSENTSKTLQHYFQKGTPGSCIKKVLQEVVLCRKCVHNSSPINAYQINLHLKHCELSCFVMHGMIVQMIDDKFKWYKNKDWLMVHKKQTYLHIFSEVRS